MTLISLPLIHKISKSKKQLSFTVWAYKWNQINQILMKLPSSQKQYQTIQFKFFYTYWNLLFIQIMVQYDKNFNNYVCLAKYRIPCQEYHLMIIFDHLIDSYKHIMLTIHSPKFSASSKGDLLSNKMSPSFRSKRIPSALDNYSCENNNIRNSKNQSPSKFSEECLRRRSQLGENNPNIVNNPKKSKDKNPQNIINSIHYLKEEYKVLKQAYKELIQQKIKNTDEISKYKSQLSKIKSQNEKICKESQKLKIQLMCLEQENDRIKRECYKMLEVQKFKAKKLEESLNQKEQYINQTLFKIRTEGDESYINTRKAMTQSGLFSGGDMRNIIEEQSLTISQDKSAQYEKDKIAANNQSQFLSFSLTSILEESTYKDSAVSQKKQHTKVVSQLTLPYHDEQIKITQIKSVKNKELSCPFKKNKKDLTNTKIDLTSQNRQMKQNQLLANLSNLVNPRSFLGVEKKSSKNKGTKSFRRKQEEKEITSELKNHKKKSRKTINLSSND